MRSDHEKNSNGCFVDKNLSWDKSKNIDGKNNSCNKVLTLKQIYLTPMKFEVKYDCLL